MKSVVKKSRLLLLSLIWFLVIWFVSVAVWITIINTSPDDSEHKVTLHSLFLEGNVTNKDLIGVESGKENLDINNWLIVGTGNTQWQGELSSIWWWSDNAIWSNRWGIWWWRSNTVNGDYSVIGGGSGNQTNWSNSVVVWWKTNKVFNGWIVLWWMLNTGTNWIVLGGYKNQAMVNSLVLWRKAAWNANSFAWNSQAEPSSARIKADSWVLIWTYNPVNGVSLVVNWSVKLDDGSDIEWAIRLNSSWCLTMYDGHTHVLGKSSKSVCGVASWCQFGSILLQDWDIVTGYKVSYSTNCNSNVISLQCNNWQLSYPSSVYPYCYNIDSNPVRNSKKNWVDCDINGDGNLDIGDYSSFSTCQRNVSLVYATCDLNGDGDYDNGDTNLYANYCYSVTMNP